MIKKLNSGNALPFILGGKALFTIKNSKTGNRFTYKVTIPKDRTPEEADLFFVKLLTGNDNSDSYSYKYIGCIRKGQPQAYFYYGRKSNVSENASGVKAFDFVFNKFIAPELAHPDLEVWHEGKCCRCGRTLTVPESIESGIGPECARIVKAA